MSTVKNRSHDRGSYLRQSSDELRSSLLAAAAAVVVGEKSNTRPRYCHEPTDRNDALDAFSFSRESHETNRNEIEINRNESQTKTNTDRSNYQLGLAAKLLTWPCLSMSLLVSFTFSNETTCFRSCSPVKGESGCT